LLLNDETTRHDGGVDITPEKVRSRCRRRGKRISNLCSTDYLPLKDSRGRGARIGIEREIVRDAIFVIKVHRNQSCRRNGNGAQVKG